MAHLKRSMSVLAVLGLLAFTLSVRADEPKKAGQDGKEEKGRKKECGHDLKDLFEKWCKEKGEGLSDEEKAKLKEKFEEKAKEHFKRWHDGEKRCHCDCQDEADDEAAAKAEAKARAEAKSDGKVEVRKEEKHEVRHRGMTREDLMELLRRKMGKDFEESKAMEKVREHFKNHPHGRCDCDDKSKEHDGKDGDKEGKKDGKEGKGDKGGKDGKGHDAKPPGKGK